MILRKCIPFFGIRRKRWRKPSIFNCIQKDSNPSLRRVTFWPKVPRSQTPSIQRALNSVHFVTLLRRRNGLVAYLCNIRPAFTLTVVKIAQAGGKIETHYENVFLWLNLFNDCVLLSHSGLLLKHDNPSWSILWSFCYHWLLQKNLLIITIFLLVTGKVNQNDMTKGRCCGMRTAISFLLKNFCRLRLVILKILTTDYTKNVNNGNIWGIKVVVTVPVVHFFPWVGRAYLKINCQPFMAIGHSQRKFSKKSRRGVSWMVEIISTRKMRSNLSLFLLAPAALRAWCSFQQGGHYSYYV